MRVPHNSVVLVADGAKMLLFRNEGDGEHLNLKAIDAEQQADPADREIKSDRDGHASSAGTTGGSMGETDPHQQAEDRFAAHAVELLNRQAIAGRLNILSLSRPRARSARCANIITASSKSGSPARSPRI